MSRIHYVDLKYKGICIRASWQHLIRKIFTVLFFVSLLLFFFVGVQRTQGFALSQLREWNMKEVGVWFLGSVIISGGIVGVLSLILFPMWDYIKNLERLCQLIWNSQFYIVNKIESPNMMQDKRTRVKREVVYFPKFYYRMRKGGAEITVKLDGSMFHKRGEYQGLSEVLEDIYALDVTDTHQRNEYFTYKLAEDVLAYRIPLHDVVPDGYKIPLMKHISWDITKTAHALVTGITGGGKTIFLNTLIYAFQQMGADLRIADPKHSMLSDYRLVFPDVVSSKEGTIELLKRVVREMEERYASVKERPDYVSGQDFSTYGLRPLVLIVDEYAALVSAIDRKAKEEFNSCVSQIIFMGREAGVCMILATQRPDTEYLKGGLRDQLGFRVSLGSMTDDGYRMTFGQTSQKLEPDREPGQGYCFVSGRKHISSFYAPLVPEHYNFVEELRKRLRMPDCAFSARRIKASRQGDEQASERSEPMVREIIYDGEDSHERSE